MGGSESRPTSETEVVAVPIVGRRLTDGGEEHGFVNKWHDRDEYAVPLHIGDTLDGIRQKLEALIGESLDFEDFVLTHGHLFPVVKEDTGLLHTVLLDQSKAGTQ